jgi:hypothetical protein
MGRPSGKGGGVYIQIAVSGAVFALPLASFRFTQDPRLGEDTESDDLGAHFSASGAPLGTGILTLHRRDASYPEALNLSPGLEINRLWFKWGALLVGGTTPKGIMLFKPTLGAFDDDVQDVAPNMPIQIQVMGGAIYRNVNLPDVGDTPDNTTPNPNP